MRQIARQQLETALSAGASVSGYVWGYWGEEPQQYIQYVMDLYEWAPLRMVWLDAEDTNGATPGVVVPWLTAASEGIRARAHAPGIYTGSWFWRPYTDDSTALRQLPLWYAHYDIEPTLLLPDPFGGWVRALGHQYTDQPVDQSIFHPSLLQ
jgi:hypothetical protein